MLVKVKPEYNLVGSELANDEEQGMERYAQILGLRFGFTEQQFSYTYFSTTDLISELGGISGIIGGIFASLAIYFVMLYIVDLVTLIQNKFVFENNKFIIRYHVIQCKNLDKFRQVINGLTQKEKEKTPGGEDEEDSSSKKLEKYSQDLELLDKIEKWIWKSAPEMLHKNKRKERQEEVDKKNEVIEKKNAEKEAKMSTGEKVKGIFIAPKPTPEEEEE